MSIMSVRMLLLNSGLNGNIPDPEIHINDDIVSNVEITGSDQTGYIYTVTYQYTIQPGENTFVIAGYYEGKQMVVGTEAERTLSLTPKEFIDLANDCELITSTEDLNDSDAVYIITTSDGRVLAPDGRINSQIGIEDTTPDYSDCFKIRSNGAGFMFQSVATDFKVNNVEGSGWSTTITNFQMGNAETYYSLEINDSGAAEVYYLMRRLISSDYYYWDYQSNIIECSENPRNPVTFKIYKVTN